MLKIVPGTFYTSVITFSFWVKWDDMIIAENKKLTLSALFLREAG
jgi:hypothetical protein